MFSVTVDYLLATANYFSAMTNQFLSAVTKYVVGE
jgi:hypothetical protein